MPILACSLALLPRTSATVRAATLRVAAAADLTRALTEIVAEYHRATGREVTVSFGATGLLTRQIENGAPYDMLLAADASFVDRLDRESLTLPGTRRVYALGTVVVWTRPDGPKPPSSLRNLTADVYGRIAIANPTVAPYGRAARQALERAGVWRAVQPRVVYGENVSQTLQFAQSGNADVALVALSLVVGQPGQYAVVPARLYAPLTQTVVALRSAAAPEARRFEAYLGRPECRAILERDGLKPPGR